jgi:hypothetical protein
MDIFDLISRQGSQNTADRLRQQMEEARRLKAIEEEGSARRMADLQAIEEARLAGLRERQKRQQAQERLYLVAGAVALGVFVVALIFYAVVMASR